MKLVSRLTGAGLAFLIAVVLSGLGSRTPVVHADGVSLCDGSAWAWAAAYDGSSGGSASGGFDLSGYSADACVGVAQTNAIFQAGLACENAGIPAGVLSGVGYAEVSWYVVWRDGDQVVETGPDTPQQYDCADTFS